MAWNLYYAIRYYRTSYSLPYYCGIDDKSNCQSEKPPEEEGKAREAENDIGVWLKEILK